MRDTEPRTPEGWRACYRDLAEARPLDVLEEHFTSKAGDSLYHEEVIRALFRRYAASGERVISILYTNHRGETARRRVIPVRVWFGATDWHPGPGAWMLEAWDVEKEALRDFALADVREWGKEPEQP